MTSEVVLVTGGSGFIAANVIKLLVEEGYQVRTTVRDSKNEAKVKHFSQLCENSEHKIEVVEADLNDADSWKSAVEGCTYVHHVASPFPMGKVKNVEAFLSTAVQGAINVLEACVSAKTVKRVVLTSSIAAILGKRTKFTAYNEDDWLDPDDTTVEPYMRSKSMAEKAAWDFVEKLPKEQKFELAVVNPSFVLGPVFNQCPGTSIELMQKLMNREYPMVPGLCFSVCDVRDVAQAHYKCMTQPEAVGHRHIIKTDTIWMKQMTEPLEKEFKPQGYNPPTRVMPDFLLKFASLFVHELRTARKFGEHITQLDNSRMTQVLGIAPTPLNKSLTDMAYSMIERGLLPKTPLYKSPSNVSS